MTCSLITGDCVREMAKMDAKSFDFIFADPPYNLQLKGDLIRPEGSKVDAVDDSWDDFTDFAAYDQFTLGWLTECKRVLKPDGSIAVMGSYHGIYRVGRIMQDLGFWLLGDIIWEKTNPMPNFAGKRFTAAHEHIIWAARSKSARPTFNYEAQKAGNEDTQERDVWRFPICQGDERLKDAEGNKLHSTQKPEALLRKLICALTKPNDTILDPFSGSGTTIAVAKELQRNAVGIDSDKNYNLAAAKRIKAVVPINTQHLDILVKDKPPRISFAAVMSAVKWPFGTHQIFHGKLFADVRPDGTIECDGFTGSIHKVAAQVSGKQSVNGWDFWQFMDAPKYGAQIQPISVLREEADKILYPEKYDELVVNKFSQNRKELSQINEAEAREEMSSDIPSIEKMRIDLADI